MSHLATLESASATCSTTGAGMSCSALGASAAERASANVQAWKASRHASSVPEARYKTLLLFGAPGAGKGTQGAILGRIPGFYHCACGDVFRNMDINGPLGKVFYEYSSRGELVPDDVTVGMWADTIAARTVLGQYKPYKDILVLDGIPRTVHQAQLLEQYLDVVQVLYLYCNDENAMFERLRKRALKDNRYDDADEKVIRRRWKVYEAETMPVLNYYPADKIVKVDSMGSPATILHDILDTIAPLQSKIFGNAL